jgi:hypothetical protein
LTQCGTLHFIWYRGNNRFQWSMLTEEALILLAALGATGMLALGVIELVWPSRPKQSRPRRARVTAPSPVDADVTGEIPRPPQTTAVVAEPAVVEPERAVVEPAPFTIAEGHVIEPMTVITEPSHHWKPAPSSIESSITLSIARSETGSLFEERAHGPVLSPMPPHAVSLGEPRLQVLPIDRCLDMYNEGRFAEVVTLGSAALELHAGMAAVSNRSDEAAALLDLVGLSKQELGDRAGARAAFCSAIRGADPRVRAKYVRRLIALVRSVTDPGTAAADDDATRLRELRACVGALDETLVMVPGDEGLQAAQAMVREALAPACERLVARVVSGEEDQEARELVLETLTDHAMPMAWRERLREQLTTVSSAEIGQLTAQAIRSLQEGNDFDALDALERAERLSAGLPSGAVTEDRREEFERRLWWGYTKVGLRRIETGTFESALEPLFRALQLGGIDEDRLAETRGALSRALEGVVDDCALRIQKLGSRQIRAARAEIEKLAALLQSATERGVRIDDLGDAFAKLTHLEQRLSEART